MVVQLTDTFLQRIERWKFGHSGKFINDLVFVKNSIFGWVKLALSVYVITTRYAYTVKLFFCQFWSGRFFVLADFVTVWPPADYREEVQKATCHFCDNSFHLWESGFLGRVKCTRGSHYAPTPRSCPPPWRCLNPPAGDHSAGFPPMNTRDSCKTSQDKKLYNMHFISLLIWYIFQNIFFLESKSYISVFSLS